MPEKNGLVKLFSFVCDHFCFLLNPRARPIHELLVFFAMFVILSVPCWLFGVIIHESAHCIPAYFFGFSPQIQFNLLSAAPGTCTLDNSKVSGHEVLNVWLIAVSPYLLWFLVLVLVYKIEERTHACLFIPIFVIFADAWLNISNLFLTKQGDFVTIGHNANIIGNVLGFESLGVIVICLVIVAFAFLTVLHGKKIYDYLRSKPLHLKTSYQYLQTK